MGAEPLASGRPPANYQSQRLMGALSPRGSRKRSPCAPPRRRGVVGNGCQGRICFRLSLENTSSEIREPASSDCLGWEELHVPGPKAATPISPCEWFTRCVCTSCVSFQRWQSQRAARQLPMWILF